MSNQTCGKKPLVRSLMLWIARIPIVLLLSSVSIGSPRNSLVKLSDAGNFESFYTRTLRNFRYVLPPPSPPSKRVDETKEEKIARRNASFALSRWLVNDRDCQARAHVEEICDDKQFFRNVVNVQRNQLTLWKHANFSRYLMMPVIRGMRIKLTASTNKQA